MEGFSDRVIEETPELINDLGEERALNNITLWDRLYGHLSRENWETVSQLLMLDDLSLLLRSQETDE